MNERIGKNWLRQAIGVAVGVALAVPALASHVSAQGFESPPALRASTLLPPSILQGPYHRVDERVLNDGYMNRYTIHSSFGEFEVVSTTKLRKRVDEIGALALMEKLEGTEEFGEALRDSGMDTLEGVKNLVTDPIDTVGGAVSGVGKVFGRVTGSLFGNERSDAEDSRLKSLIGFSETKREYAAEFGVDVYSHNVVLQERLDELGWTGFAGGLTAGVAMAAVPGGAGVALSVTNTADMLNDVFRNTAPVDLRKMNREKLLTRGVSEDVADLFLNNTVYTPREQTLLVAALEKMRGVRKRETFVKLAVLTDNTDIAYFRQRQAQLYAAYHEKVTRISSFVSVGKLAAASLSDGTIVFVVPLDYLAWTRGIASFVETAESFIRQHNNPPAKQLWLSGSATDLARTKLAARGWTLRENVEEVLLPRLPY